MTTQEILFNVSGQSFFYDPPEGRCSGTPTVTVYRSTSDDDGQTITATTGAASVDSVNTTFSASSGALSLSVADGTGITRGRRYLITDVDGDREWVECISITGATVGVRQPLRNNYVAGSAFQGCRISISVDSTWMAARSNISDILDTTSARVLATDLPVGAAGYRLRWAYTVGGVNCIGVSFADLVRYQAKNLVTPLDVDRRFPGWVNRLPTDYQEDQGAALIDEAFAAIKMDALGDEHVLRRIRDTQVIRDLTIYRTNVLAQQASLFDGGTNGEQVKAAEDLYANRYKQLIREPKVPEDQTGGGASAQANRLPAWRR